MKKLKISLLENLDESEQKVFNFLEKTFWEDISKISISLEAFKNINHTTFCFLTKKGQSIEFLYSYNEKIHLLRLIGEILYVGEIATNEEKEKEKWVNSIWEQFVEHFNLRIRLMFINKTTPWKWNTKFTY